ncbi:hypothetical protein [Butyrivibrio sp. INlla14]|uniref:hypothetical protein n=1 Tax=Butyrivibrio sp. INlla14 TaxID=1520808 RepID=UPI0008771ACF|nr:hypothetical protein [Butyrivibrio sp. INlla14]SCY11515.1 hypothetical protein SAMN02910371_01120 [Butyrivibrio sp. INlla14]
MIKGNFCKTYGEATARDRAELIYSHYSSFLGIIEDCKARLIYEIKAEKEYCRSHHKDDLGVRVQTSIGTSDTTGDEAILNVTLAEQLDSDKLPNLKGIDLEAQEQFRARHRVIVMMRDEYTAFDKHLYSLSADEQKIIFPVLKHTKDYYQIAQEENITVETVRKRVSRTHKNIIEHFGEIFIERLQGGM